MKTKFTATSSDDGRFIYIGGIFHKGTCPLTIDQAEELFINLRAAVEIHQRIAGLTKLTQCSYQNGRRMFYGGIESADAFYGIEPSDLISMGIPEGDALAIIAQANKSKFTP